MKRVISVVSLIAVLSLILSSLVYAHCDTLDGPVIQDARIALEKGDVTSVLKWVKQKNENEIQAVFDNALIERKENKESGDMKFFEALVRIHREGEGADYTGVKPAGTVEPAVAKADKAMEEGSVDNLAEKIGSVVASGIKKRFTEVMEAKKHMNDSVAEGRKYVAAYVEYVHYVEAVHNLATSGSAHEHENE